MNQAKQYTRNHGEYRHDPGDMRLNATLCDQRLQPAKQQSVGNTLGHHEAVEQTEEDRGAQERLRPGVTTDQSGYITPGRSRTSGRSTVTVSGIDAILIALIWCRYSSAASDDAALRTTRRDRFWWTKPSKTPDITENTATTPAT